MKGSAQPSIVSLASPARDIGVSPRDYRQERVPIELELTLSFLGGVVLFLFGMQTMATALREVAGARMKLWLGRATANRFLGVGTGVIATVALDSSSVTSIMVVGLVDAALLTLVQGLAVVLGANIGTTLSSQLIAFDVAKLAPIGMLVGILIAALARKNAKRRAWGHVLLGLGVLLFALDYIGTIAEPFRDDPALRGWMQALREPVWGVLAGAAVTAVIQSSSATVGIVIVLASRGAIPIEAGIAIMLGAEVGTCVDTLVSSIGRSRNAVRIALFQLLFNVTTVALGVAVIGPITSAATLLSDDVGHQIANAHVIFNVGGVLLALPLVQWIERGLVRLLPDRAAEGESPMTG